MPAANIGEAADDAQHFAKLHRTLPRHGERCDGAGTRTADAVLFRIF
jgi:hypothetical protein